jgi:hypothetical protein
MVGTKERTEGEKRTWIKFNSLKPFMEKEELEK